jgi:hypothetical protein
LNKILFKNCAHIDFLAIRRLTKIGAEKAVLLLLGVSNIMFYCLPRNCMTHGKKRRRVEIYVLSCGAALDGAALDVS